jgi:hypothetical protein
MTASLSGSCAGKARRYVIAAAQARRRVMTMIAAQ